MKTFVRLAAASAMVFALGCAGSNDKCDVLAQKVCDGKGDAYCKRVEGWLGKQLTGPDGQKLSKSTAGKACKMIVDDANALKAYQKKAHSDLGS